MTGADKVGMVATPFVKPGPLDPVMPFGFLRSGRRGGKERIKPERHTGGEREREREREVCQING